MNRIKNIQGIVQEIKIPQPIILKMTKSILILLSTLFIGSIGFSIYILTQYTFVLHELTLTKQQSQLLQDDIRDYVFFSRIIVDNLAATLGASDSVAAKSYNVTTYDIYDKESKTLFGTRGLINVSVKAKDGMPDTSSQFAYSILEDVPNIWPLHDGVGYITTLFGMTVDPFTGGPYDHKGIDICVSRIGDPVLSTANGKVVAVGFERKGYGNFVVISHLYGFMTLYAHLDAIEVKWGQTVKKGTVIGTVGTTGRSTGPHLHYEIRIESTPVNPLRYVTMSSMPMIVNKLTQNNILVDQGIKGIHPPMYSDAITNFLLYYGENGVGGGQPFDSPEH